VLDFLQVNRPLQIQSPLPAGSLLLAGLSGREAVNELYEFRLHLLSPVILPPWSFSDLLGKSVIVTLEPGDGLSRYFTGQVMSLEQTHRDLEFVHFQAIVRPPFWLATLRINSRIFQQMTAPEILKAVLGPLGTIEMKLTGGYPVRDFTCQYQETDWSFVSRIMEEEGIFYMFEHTIDGPRLILADSLTGLATSPMPGPLRFDNESSVADNQQYRCWSWRKTQTVVPTHVTVWDHHFELFQQHLDATAGPPTSVTTGAVVHQPVLMGSEGVPVYFHSGDYAKRYDGVTPGGGDQSAKLPEVYADAQRTARLRLESLNANAVRIEGEGNCPFLIPGQYFMLSDHFDGDGKYLARSLEHHIETRGTYRAGQPAAESVYRCRFSAAPADLIPRPSWQTPRPKIGGPLTAVVVGPPGQEIFVDKYGRVKVQFFWDRQGQSDANSSCWIRCAQLWAGKNWGAFFWPRIGMEVVVHFEDGDPDRPVITGCVYNSANMPPPELPTEAGIAGIKTMIFGGIPSAHYNGIFFFDQPEYQYVELHSMRHEMRTSVRNSVDYTPRLKVSINGKL
jgi:type VI secretion system secreted protein VgrG